MNSSNGRSQHRKTNWWKKRTILERLLILSLILALLILIAITVAFIVTSVKDVKHESPTPSNNINETDTAVCLDHGCIRSALSVLDSIDQSTDPCVDFYQFACGGFLKRSFIPDDETSISAFFSMGETIEKRLKSILSEPSLNNEPRPFALVKELYRSCMNASAIETEGFQTLIHKLLPQLGGWPVLESKYWDERGFSWESFAYESRKLGLGSGLFLEISLENDKLDSSRKIITINEATLEFGKENFLEGFQDHIVQSYYSYMVDLAVTLGADRRSAEIELKKAVEFEIELAKICLSLDEIRNATAFYNQMTIEEMEDQFPGIPWLSYINNTIALPNVTITVNDTVEIENEHYIEGLVKLLNNTSKRVQANFALFKVVYFAVPFLNEELRERKQQYDKALYGTRERSPRWEDCVVTVTNEFSLAAGALYVREHFSKDAKDKVVEIVSDIREEFRRTLEKTDWMDETTRAKALKKAEAMKFHVAYANELFNDSKVEEYYKDVTVDFSSFLKFVLSIQLSKMNKMWSKYGKVREEHDWTARVTPIVVNAFYKSDKNEIELPAGILQGIVFDSERPQYMNFASVGYTIGHEITHGFDDKGKEYDEGGSLKDWWASDTESAFEKRAECMVNQYKNILIPELNMTLNGVSTQGENIADNGGVKLAYRAYEAWVKRNGEEPTLPGLNYTQRQMFWISAGNIWCEKVRKEELKQDLRNDFHPPSKYRVEVPLQNSLYFAKDFGCPVGSKMNPKDKCQVW